jgi:hypothetical protein
MTLHVSNAIRGTCAEQYMYTVRLLLHVMPLSISPKGSDSTGRCKVTNTTKDEQSHHDSRQVQSARVIGLDVVSTEHLSCMEDW